jgi:hypothetical protein
MMSVDHTHPDAPMDAAGILKLFRMYERRRLTSLVRTGFPSLLLWCGGVIVAALLWMFGDPPQVGVLLLGALITAGAFFLLGHGVLCWVRVKRATPQAKRIALLARQRSWNWSDATIEVDGDHVTSAILDSDPSYAVSSSEGRIEDRDRGLLVFRDGRIVPYGLKHLNADCAAAVGRHFPCFESR